MEVSYTRPVALRERGRFAVLLTTIFYQERQQPAWSNPDRRHLRAWHQLVLAILIQRRTRLPDVARLQAAQAALKLAAVLLDADPSTAQPIWEQFNAVSVDLTTWQRSGRGWFEERLVRRGQKQHGPYRYFRWRDADGKTHTHYLGRIAALTDQHQEPTIPAPLPVDATEPSAWRGRVQPVRIGSTKKVHLMLPEPGETTTLCGRPLGAQPLRAVVFQYDDCARCRTVATTLGRVCAQCGNPLVMPAGPEICVNCALRSTTD